ncbi:hypothetical protein [Mycoplana rhizolycopersici]|uniref:DUF4238 domain-containing protein n=1 Tax=Mycoplana rhizolycopersici TaxID=2746702 RepID=A0ABX2QK17_9HYPH|nr:hypothetical protein [Rhizobium rhizolycopersici]NVP57583.1 hypothetical protein [Rhizobium rhizolycopersici]
MSGSIKTGLHHWWPKGLSTFWVGDDDCVTRITPEGKEFRSPPAQFGGITNGHAVKLDGPWSFSFEAKFDAVDSRLPYLVNDLLKYEARRSSAAQPLAERLQAHRIPNQFMEEMGKTLASLIVRSPSHRNKVAKTTEYYQGRMGFSEPKADKNLINMNLSNKMEFISRNFNGGKYVIAFSDEAEFIFGDGFYTNMSNEHALGHRKTVLPATPIMTVIYTRPTQYFTEPRLMTIRLEKEEVLRFNELIQVYSKDQLFYRSQRPNLNDAFKRAEFLEFRYHNVPWLDKFLESVHRCRL